MPRPRELILVLTAVQLDDQHAFDAAEIDDVRTDRLLAAKLHAQLMPPQTDPEPPLSVSLFADAVGVPYRAERGGALMHED